MLTPLKRNRRVSVARSVSSLHLATQGAVPPLPDLFPDPHSDWQASRDDR
jgi:hypothetical protein